LIPSLLLQGQRFLSSGIRLRPGLGQAETGNRPQS
jgi:hypothetical protein